MNYTLDVVSMDPVTTKIQGSFLTQLLYWKEAAQGFTTLKQLDMNGCDKKKNEIGSTTLKLLHNANLVKSEKKAACTEQKYFKTCILFIISH